MDSLFADFQPAYYSVNLLAFIRMILNSGHPHCSWKTILWLEWNLYQFLHFLSNLRFGSLVGGGEFFLEFSLLEKFYLIHETLTKTEPRQLLLKNTLNTWSWMISATSIGCLEVQSKLDKTGKKSYSHDYFLVEHWPLLAGSALKLTSPWNLLNLFFHKTSSRLLYTSPFGKSLHEDEKSFAVKSPATMVKAGGSPKSLDENQNLQQYNLLKCSSHMQVPRTNKSEGILSQ